MENNYYTPELSDLYIGYECETAPKPSLILGELLYTPYVITGEYPIGNHFKYGIIRTPYLTKEQIEAEGWKLLEDDDGQLMFEGKRFLGISPSEDNHYRVNYYTDTKSLLVWRYYANGHEDVYFDGNCPSINEFRKITKLLGINK